MSNKQIPDKSDVDNASTESLRQAKNLTTDPFPWPLTEAQLSTVVVGSVGVGKSYDVKDS